MEERQQVMELMLRMRQNELEEDRQRELRRERFKTTPLSTGIMHTHNYVHSHCPPQIPYSYLHRFQEHPW
jgi:hypothetical protein